MKPIPPADYHIHTALCRHAMGMPKDYAEQALKFGFLEIGFSDHSPMPIDDYDDWRMRVDQLGEYIESVQRARHDVKNIDIKIGLEIDYIPGDEAWIGELTAKCDWDYLFGSVHYVSDGFVIDDPRQLDRWQEQDVFDVWADYYDRLTKAASSGLFDIIGHVDLCKKLGFVPDRDCSPLYEPFFKAAGAHNVAIELNTAGFRKPCKEQYPSEALLCCAAEHKIGLVFGSDAHDPVEVGKDFATAIDLAKRAGFTHSLSFTRRTASKRHLIGCSAR